MKKLKVKRIMRKNYYHLFMFIFLIIGSTNVFGQYNKLVWSDEFTDGIGPDWVVDWGDGCQHGENMCGWGNGEWQWYKEENLTVSDGVLRITAKNDLEIPAGQPRKLTSGKLMTFGKKSWTYGKIEARIQFPDFGGSFAAFWMLGENIGPDYVWPKCGEIDIVEHINWDDNILGTLHWDNNGHKHYGGNLNIDAAQYHRYAIEWDEKSIKWMVDDIIYHEANIENGINGTEEFHKPHYIILNMAVGGELPGYNIQWDAFPQTMNVDYVRVYEKEPIQLPSKFETEFFDEMFGVKLGECDSNGEEVSYVGWVDDNDWMTYNINVPATGRYIVEYNVASLNGGGEIQIEKRGGSPVYGSIEVPRTDKGWCDWTTISHEIELEAGEQAIGIKAVKGGFNIDWIRITEACVPTVITPQLRIDGGELQNASSASIEVGQSIELAPAAEGNGNWSWTGAAGFSAFTREISINSIGSNEFGKYTVTFTNSEGCESSMSFVITNYGQEEFFTFGVIPDTQNLVDQNGEGGAVWDITGWYVENKEELNLKFVASLGDMTQWGGLAEWARVKPPYNFLRENEVPYAPCMGNHDAFQGPIDNMIATFPVSEFSNQDYWGGTFENRGIHNSYYYFSASGMDFLVVVIQSFDPHLNWNDQAVIDWANDVISAPEHRNHRTILVTHNFYDQPYRGILEENLLTKHDNLFLAVCGHACENNGEDNWIVKSPEGNDVHCVLSDYQCRGNSQEAWLRYYTFYPAENKISAQTYCRKDQYGNQYPGTQFDLDYDMSANSSIKSTNESEKEYEFATSLDTKLFETNDLLVYPNPVGSTLFIKGLNNNAKLEVYNLSGAKVTEGIGKEINTSGLFRGAYILQVTTKDRVSKIKFNKK